MALFVYLDGCVHGHQSPTALWSDSALSKPVSVRLTQKTPHDIHSLISIYCAFPEAAQQGIL